MHSAPSISHQLQSQQAGMPTPTLAAPAIDQKIAEIRSRVLEIIRATMPITTLFTPGLKIDLHLFLNDQMLFQRLAVFIAPLAGMEDLNPEDMEKHFEGSELLAEIKGMFKETVPNLLPFYTACCDVVKERTESAPIQPALEARIYTLKNALVALQTPAAIQNSQKLNKIPVQKAETIKEEGLQFIKAALSIHVRSLETEDALPFTDRLSKTVEQLLAFVEVVTCSYLRENDRTVPGDIYTYRNPTGYNCHGEMANAVLEVCLNALGYTTVLRRSLDLEPRVTLAMHHALAEVTAPDNTTFVIDLCYRQFHKDILLDESKIPQTPFLLLNAQEVNAYVEENIMPLWKSIFHNISVPWVAKKLQQEDKYLAFKIDKLSYVPEHKQVHDIEKWVRESFRTLWNITDYAKVVSNVPYYTVFNEPTAKKGTYEMIKGMNIGSLTHYRPLHDIRKELESLCKDPSHQAANSPRALDLMGQLPHEMRYEFRSLLDVDPRPFDSLDMDVCHIAYYRSVCKTVNPEGKRLKGLYGCSGADALSSFLSTNAEEFTFVDMTELSLEELKETKKSLAMYEHEMFSPLYQQMRKQEPVFFDQLSFTCSSGSSEKNGVHKMKNLSFKLIYNLLLLGVNIYTIEFSQQADAIRIEFPWQYHGESDVKKRSITYICADITKPEKYPEALKKTLADGIDLFYLKGAYYAPLSFPDFIPQMARAIPRGGWLLMAEETVSLKTVDPTPDLNKAGQEFVKVEKEEISMFQDLLQVSFSPIHEIPSLKYIARELRAMRTATPNEEYWSLLTMRQKV